MTPVGLTAVGEERIDLGAAGRSVSRVRPVRTSRPSAPGSPSASARPLASSRRPSPRTSLFLENVRSLPRILAIFLAFLGLAAVGHVLVTAVRRAGADLAILRAMGFRPIQAAACIGWQATIVGDHGSRDRCPTRHRRRAARVALGRRQHATALRRPVAVAAVLLIVPATLLVANVLAALPARRAARIRPATVLRTE